MKHREVMSGSYAFGVKDGLQGFAKTPPIFMGERLERRLTWKTKKDAFHCHGGCLTPYP